MVFRRRLLLLYLLLAGALAVVWARAFQLQVLDHHRWVEEAARRRTRERTVPGTRGRIVSADGEVLAEDQTVVRLLFVPGEWASRERFWCRSCGAVVFRPTPRWSSRPDRPPVRPRACSCGAPGSAFEALAPEDLAPLEDALRLPPGTLAGIAEDRMQEIEERVEASVAETVLDMPRGALRREAAASGRTLRETIEARAPEVEEEAFRAEDLRRLRRADWYGRPVPLTTFPMPGEGVPPIVLKSLDERAEALLEGDAQGRFRGFRAGPATERVYPQKSLLAPLVGYVGPLAFDRPEARREWFAQKGERDRGQEVRAGRIGLEAYYEDALRGLPGRVREERDEDGVFSRRTIVDPARAGADLSLHLSVSACREAQRALVDAATYEGYCVDGPPSGGFVALDAVTGAVLAWADTPSFDPNGSLREVTDGLERAEKEDAEAARSADAMAFADVRPGPVWSRVARVGVEPGSTLKIQTVLTLLHSGHPLPEEYHCAGPDERAPKPKCHTHGPVGPEGAIAQSCNRYCADCASALGMPSEWLSLHQELFPAWAARLGIGQKSRLDFPSDPVFGYPRRPDLGLLRQLSIGQSVLATPVQMARLCAFVANGTHLPAPRIAASVGGRDVGLAPVPVEADPSALARVRAGMRACVTEGTARTAFEGVDLHGAVVYGKTGTATVTGKPWMERRRPAPEGTRRTDPQHLWFVGFAERPGERTVAFAIVLHGRWVGMGSDAAAPAVARFLSRWFAPREGG